MTLAGTTTVYAEEEYTIGIGAVCSSMDPGQPQRASGRTERESRIEEGKNLLACRR